MSVVPTLILGQSLSRSNLGTVLSLNQGWTALSLKPLRLMVEPQGQEFEIPAALKLRLRTRNFETKMIGGLVLTSGRNARKLKYC